MEIWILFWLSWTTHPLSVIVQSEFAVASGNHLLTLCCQTLIELRHPSRHAEPDASEIISDSWTWRLACSMEASVSGRFFFLILSGCKHSSIMSHHNRETPKLSGCGLYNAESLKIYRSWSRITTVMQVLHQTTKLLSRCLASLTPSVTLAAHGLISSMQAKLGTGTKGSSPASSSENTKEGTKRSLSAGQEWTLCAEGSARPGEKTRRGLSCPQSCLVSLISSSLMTLRSNCQMGATNKCTKRAYWSAFTL